MQASRSSSSRPASNGRVMLLRALSKLGICSRQQAKRAIYAGRVQVNGKVITQHTHWVDLARDMIMLDGQLARRAEKMIYLMLNKPAGYVTTRRDNLNRPTVFDLISPRGEANETALSSQSPWVFPVGRLDFDSEGLLLFTNDGPFGDALASPERHVHKVYRVLLDHLPSLEELRRLEQGIPILDYVTLPCKIAIEAAASNNDEVGKRSQKSEWVRISIREGKNRQIRRMFAAAGCEVRRLIRMRFGPLELGDLAAGHWRELTAHEINALRRAVES
ncbi:MAG: pseudouridine synthase [bacterium]